MNYARLEKWGKRGIVAGLALLPVDIVLVTLFVVLVGDPIGTISLTMSLLALSVTLVGFGIAAVSSCKAELAEREQAADPSEAIAEQVPPGEMDEPDDKRHRDD